LKSEEKNLKKNESKTSEKKKISAVTFIGVGCLLLLAVSMVAFALLTDWSDIRNMQTAETGDTPFPFSGLLAMNSEQADASTDEDIQDFTVEQDDSDTVSNKEDDKTSKKEENEKKEPESKEPEGVEFVADSSQNEKPEKVDVEYFVDEDQYRIDLTPVKEEIEEIITRTKQSVGGDWSIYITIPSTGDTLSMNQKKMQSASVVKLFIMGAVYDDYDAILRKCDETELEELIEKMIIVSDNASADELVTLLGRGDSDRGKRTVTNFCHEKGLVNTNMSRLLQENSSDDNYTTTEDTAKFLEMILNGELSHSKEMLRHLENQERTSKIPAGIPKDVTIANKTGELEDVQNDAAIVFAKKPYIICIMADGVQDYQTPIDAIVEISNKSYNYLVTKM